MLPLALGLLLAQTPPSQCAPTERAIVTCAAKKKVLSVCAGPKEGVPTWLQYRFGPPGKPELTFPADKKGSLAAFSLETRTLIDGTEVTTLTFSNADTLYEVYTQEGRSSGAGVNVTPKGKPLISVACTSAAPQTWDDLKFYVKGGAPECVRAGVAYANWAMAQSKGHMDGVQQSELGEAVTALCEGWSPEARSCMTAGAGPCPGLTEPQKKALSETHLRIVPP